MVLTLIPLGIVAHDAPFATSEELQWKAFLFSIHKTLGVAVFFIALARIAWAITQPKPGLLNADNKPEAFLAQTIHWLLYSALVLVPLTGWIHHAATEGFAPIWWPFGQNLPFVPTNDLWVAHLFGSLHFAFERVLAFSVLLHIAGALKHHVIDRDATLRRMLPGYPALPDLPAQTHSRLPILAAVAAYGVALVVGTFLWYLPGLETPKQPVETTQTETQGNWQVTDGTLAITVKQLGSDVRGEFANWSADITFDETVESGVAGQVEVTVDIASLTLGSVTEQAMGADFFDAANHPTAVFAADITRTGDAYTADGTLTMKGVKQRVSLPFTLALDGDTATMVGTLTLQRLDFGVGQSMPDESNVGFAVGVDVALTAEKTE